MRARRDLTLAGNRKVSGPKREKVRRRHVNGKWEPEFLPLNVNLGPHESYDVVETSPGDTFEVDQTLAKELVFRGDADLVGGAMVTIIQMRDGAHCYLPRAVPGNAWGKPADSRFELAELLMDSAYAFAWPDKAGGATQDCAGEPLGRLLLPGRRTAREDVQSLAPTGQSACVRGVESCGTKPLG